MTGLLTRRTGFSMSCVVLLAVTAIPQPAEAVRNIDIGDTLPYFALPYADGTANVFRSDQLAGQPAAVIFWRPNHDLSLEALRDLQAVAQVIGVARVKILAVDAKRSAAQEVRAALAHEAISFPIVLDPQRILYEQVGLIVCPTTLLFDAQGKLRFVAASHPRQFRQVVEARLRFLLGEIDEQTMELQIKPTVREIPHDLAAAWRMYNLGKALQAEDKPDEAAAAYQRAIAHHPALTEAHCALGFLSLEAGRLQTAEQHFQSALAQRADSPVARLGQAAVLARTGRAQQAEGILVALLTEESKSVAARVRYELGRICQSRGEFEKAAGYYQDALTFFFSEPRSPSADAASTR